MLTEDIVARIAYGCVRAVIDAIGDGIEESRKAITPERRDDLLRRAGDRVSDLLRQARADRGGGADQDRP